MCGWMWFPANPILPATAFRGCSTASSMRRPIVFERGQESQPDKSTVIAPGVPELLAFDELAIQPVSLPKEAWQPERRPWVLESYLAAAQEERRERRSGAGYGERKACAAEKQLARSESATFDNDSRSGGSGDCGCESRIAGGRARCGSGAS